MGVLMGSGCEPSERTLEIHDGRDVFLEPSFIDLGNATINKPIHGSFLITNRYKETLRIIKVDPKCGCTIATPEKLELTQGESVRVAFTVAREELGPFTSKIDVMTTRGDLVLRYKVNTQTNASWLIQPSAVILPESRRMQAAEGVIEIKVLQSYNADITSVKTKDDWLAAELTKIAPAEFQIRLSKMPAARSGLLATYVCVNTNDLAYPYFEIPVRAIVSDSLYISPNPIIFPETRLGEIATLRMTLGGWEGPPPEVTLDQAVMKCTGVRADQTLEYKLMTVVVRPGMQTRTLYFFQAGKLIKELPVLILGNE